MGWIGSWLNRSRRVLLALTAIWVVAVFDLGFTLSESATPEFVELNPVAAPLLSGPNHHVMFFKFGLLGGASIILLSLRRHLVAELGTWFLMATMIYVGVRWYLYYDGLLTGNVNPFIEIVK